jgi:hypothetical protein
MAYSLDDILELAKGAGRPTSDALLFAAGIVAVRTHPILQADLSAFLEVGGTIAAFIGLLSLGARVFLYWFFRN